MGGMGQKKWLLGGVAMALLLLCAFAMGRVTTPAPSMKVALVPAPTMLPTASNAAPIKVYAHNLLLRKGEHFRIYVRWIRGELLRTHAAVNPSFSEPQSFVLQIDKGILSVQLKDLADFLNSGTGTGSSLKNITLQGEGDTLALHGVLHHVLPVKVLAELAPMPDGRVQFHVRSISVLKMPVKGLLGMLHLKLNNLIASPQVPGVEVDGNFVRFDTEKLLPPPHIHGKLTAVLVSPEDLKVVYGGAGDDEGHLERWHNFFRFTGGTLDLGKLTMHDVDLTMIDASQARWFDLDLVNYQKQLVYGYTRTTEQGGMEIYMPDLGEVAEKKNSLPVTLDWLKNRDSSLPSDVPFKDGKAKTP